jgi:hypothetical protein
MRTSEVVSTFFAVILQFALVLRSLAVRFVHFLGHGKLDQGPLELPIATSPFIRNSVALVDYGVVSRESFIQA